MIRSTRLLAILLLAATATAASAQPGTLQVNETQAGVPGFFYLVRPGDATVTVTAVGNVGATGRYVLSAGTTVADLLALRVEVPSPAQLDRSECTLLLLERIAVDQSNLFLRQIFFDFSLIFLESLLFCHS